MKKIQTFFHRRKRTMAFFLAGAIAAASFVPKLVSAYNLDDGWYSSPQAECTWGDNSLAMQNKPAKYVPTGLAFNSAVYTFNPALLPPETASKLNINEYWGLGAQNFLVMRPGYENSEFAMFDGRHTYCAGTHEVAAGIQPGAQAFAADENGFSLPNKPYAAAHKGSNPDFNFLIVAGPCLLLPGGLQGPGGCGVFLPGSLGGPGHGEPVNYLACHRRGQAGLPGSPEGCGPGGCGRRFHPGPGLFSEFSIL